MLCRKTYGLDKISVPYRSFIGIGSSAQKIAHYKGALHSGDNRRVAGRNCRCLDPTFRIKVCSVSKQKGNERPVPDLYSVAEGRNMDTI